MRRRGCWWVWACLDWRARSLRWPCSRCSWPRASPQCHRGRSSLWPRARLPLRPSPSRRRLALHRPGMIAPGLSPSSRCGQPWSAQSRRSQPRARAPRASRSLNGRPLCRRQGRSLSRRQGRGLRRGRWSRRARPLNASSPRALLRRLVAPRSKSCRPRSVRPRGPLSLQRRPDPHPGDQQRQLRPRPAPPHAPLLPGRPGPRPRPRRRQRQHCVARSMSGNRRRLVRR